MLMKPGERWHCINPQCRCEVLVESESQVAGRGPRCVCGEAMKRNYVPPVFKYLDFLRPDDVPELQERSEAR